MSTKDLSVLQKVSKEYGSEGGAGLGGLWTVRAAQFVKPKTICRVIIDHPGSLHKCIADRWSHKLETTVLEIFAHGFCFASCPARPELSNRCVWSCRQQIARYRYQTSRIRPEQREWPGHWSRLTRTFTRLRTIPGFCNNCWILSSL